MWLSGWSAGLCHLHVSHSSTQCIRIPFYYFLKTLFLLYLVLPQTQGASYVYAVHVYPFLAAREPEIDAQLIRVKESAWKWINDRVRAIWDALLAVGPGREPSHVNVVPTLGEEAPPVNPNPPVPPSNMPVQLIQGLWRTYGPTIATYLQAPPLPRRVQPSPPPSPPVQSAPPQPQASSSAVDLQAQRLARRRALEAELAALRNEDPSPTLSTVGSTYLLHGEDRGRYEEIGVDDASGDEGFTRGNVSRTSWWGWGNPARGFERVKTE